MRSWGKHDSVADLNGLLLAANNGDIIFVNEAHEMRRAFQTALYLAARQGMRLHQRRELLATTYPHCLLFVALGDNGRVLPAPAPPGSDEAGSAVEFYSEQELGQIIRHRGRALGCEIDDALIPEIAHRSKGTPRLALHLLQSCHRVRRSLGGGGGLLPVFFFVCVCVCVFFFFF